MSVSSLSSRKRSKYGVSTVPNVTSSFLRTQKYEKEAERRSQNRILRLVDSGISLSEAQRIENERKEKKKGKTKKSKEKIREKLRNQNKNTNSQIPKKIKTDGKGEGEEIRERDENHTKQEGEGESLLSPTKKRKVSALPSSSSSPTDVSPSVSSMTLPSWQIRKFSSLGVPLRPFTQKQKQREIDKLVNKEFERQMAIWGITKIQKINKNQNENQIQKESQNKKHKENPLGESDNFSSFLLNSSLQILSSSLLPRPKLTPLQKSQLFSLPKRKEKHFRKEEKLRRKKERRAQRNLIIQNKIQNGEIKEEELLREKIQRKEEARQARIAKSLQKQKIHNETKKILREIKREKGKIKGEILNTKREVNKIKYKKKV